VDGAVPGSSRLIRLAAAAAASLTAALCVAVALATAAAPAPARIVAIGDVHGDADAFAAILRKAGLVDDSLHWSGGNATLVQTGDLPDRGTQVKRVFDLAMALESQAPASGGRAIFLIGNHDAMNAIGELRDVSRETFATFADASSERRREDAWRAFDKVTKSRRNALEDVGLQVPASFAKTTREDWLAAHPPGRLEYLDAFGEGGPYGRWIRGHDATVVLDGVDFLHGGWNPEVAPASPADANDRIRGEIARWDALRRYLVEHKLAPGSFTFPEILDAARVEIALHSVRQQRGSGPSAGSGATTVPIRVPPGPLESFQALSTWWLVDPDGPLWFRGFATWTPEEGAAALPKLPAQWSALRFVVGHTVVKDGRIATRFGGRVFLIDTGMSSVYRSTGGRPSALEIDEGRFTAITLDDRTQLFDEASTHP
jgi:hypothetical protein